MRLECSEALLFLCRARGKRYLPCATLQAKRKEESPRVMSTDRSDQLRAIRDAVVNLTASPLYDYRVSNNYFPVIGQGDHYADIMFIGEAPGKNEAETGRPFCGASGRILDELLGSIDLKREDVYVTNILKDRPPNNRDPLKNEIELYTPFLEQQIEIIQPKVIATLGRFSMEFILRHFGAFQVNQKISQLHGAIIKVRTGYGPVSVVPLFHPAAALYNASQRDTLEKDFQVLKQFDAPAQPGTMRLL
jgi:DNA polymerase